MARQNNFAVRFPHFGIFLVIAIALAIPLTVWSLNNVPTQTQQHAANNTSGSTCGPTNPKVLCQSGQACAYSNGQYLCTSGYSCSGISGGSCPVGQTCGYDSTALTDICTPLPTPKPISQCNKFAGTCVLKGTGCPQGLSSAYNISCSSSGYYCCMGRY